MCHCSSYWKLDGGDIGSVRYQTCHVISHNMGICLEESVVTEWRSNEVAKIDWKHRTTFGTHSLRYIMLCVILFLNTLEDLTYMV